MDQWQQRYPGAVGPGIRQAGGQGMNPGAGAMGGGTPNVQAAAAQVKKQFTLINVQLTERTSVQSILFTNVFLGTTGTTKCSRSTDG